MTESHPASHSLDEYFDLSGIDQNDTKNSRPKDTGWTSITRIRTARTTTVEPDIFDLLGPASTPARNLFLEIKLRMDYRTHCARLSRLTEDRSQKNQDSKAITELANTGKGLARRVPRSGIVDRQGNELRARPSTFMLTPEYIYPCHFWVDDIRFIWEQCAK